jgi:hypothetical protein
MHFEGKCYDDIMEKHFRVRKGLGLTQAASKEEYFGFSYQDVVLVHGHKQGWGAGLFFRLSDNRVIDVAGQPHDPNPVWYDATTH